MARILLNTTCALQANSSFIKTNTYYDIDRREAQNSPITHEDTPAFTCSPFQLPAGTFLESYCVVVNAAGVKRTATSGSGIVQLYKLTDVADKTCDLSDLAITYQMAFPTSNSAAKDGRLVIEANSTHPPIACYVPTLGAPTTIRTFNTSTPNPTYQFVYEQIPVGTYVATLQDNNNSQRNSHALVVQAGTVAIDPNITWFKYKYKNNGDNVPQITGYAWNKTTKQGYTVDGININIPVWQEYTPGYAQGTQVLWTYAGDWRVFVAVRNITADPKRGNVPTPSDDSMRDGDWSLVNDGYHYLIGSARYTINEFDATINGAVFLYYAADTIVTYRYNNYYKAKQALDGRKYQGTTLPFPEVGASNSFWEYLPNYTAFSYSVPESKIVDSYPVGKAIRSVSYYLKNPAKPNFVPTATIVVPAPDGDYVLLNDTYPDAENNSGDLEIVDIIINNEDEQGAENGSVWIYATSPSLPITFHLINGVRPGYQQDNTTGIYENLHAGDYEFYATDAAGRVVRETFTITSNFSLRWRLKFDDLHGNLLETKVFEKGWTGEVTDAVGTDEPTFLTWGTSGNLDGYLPESQGAGLQFNVYAQVARQFVATCLKSDREHRVDFYRAGSLHFRGYIDTTSYTEALLSGPNKVTLVATCGLAGLSDTPFINYKQQRQVGRTNMLSILLKTISYCSVNLPINCGINLREKLMSTIGDPLAEAYVHRHGYDKKDGKYVPIEDYIDARTVLHNILRLFNAQLFQAAGAWYIIALNEVDEPTVQVRKWTPAGTLLATSATTAPTLRILPPEDATGDKELFWLLAEQQQNVVAAARLGKATVDLKLETSLLENGDFTDWVSNRPANWTANSGLVTAKAKGQKVKEYAVKFSGYSTSFDASQYLLSPPAPHLTGQQEDYMRLTINAIVDPLTTNPTPATLTLFFQLVCDGVPYLDPIAVPLSSADKWKENTVDLPLGMPGTRVRIRVLAPVADFGSPASELRINSLHLSIQPGQYDWSSLTSDFEEAKNGSVNTGIILDDIAVANADLPLLPNINGAPLAPKAMDVFAWRHAISLADYTATKDWKRDAYPDYNSLLFNIAQDRVSMRAAPATVVTGTVAGPGITYLRQGLMLDMPGEMDGKFLVTSCDINERKGTAKITCYKLSDGLYDGALLDLPDGVRIAKNNGKLGYRIAVGNGTEAYRIAHL